MHEYNDVERKALRRAMGAELAAELGIRLPDES
jgi:hypothetical protein